jgi:two-component system, cell cycle response regulator
MGKEVTRRRFILAIGIAALALHIAHGELGLGAPKLNDFFDNWLYDAVIVSGAMSCLLRAGRKREERLPWLLLGIGLAFNAAGEIYYSLVYGLSGNVPTPSFNDVLYLSYYPGAYAGLVLLIRARIDRFSASTWLDGAIAAATATSVVAALLFDPIAHAAVHGSAAAVATNFAYPVGDLILLAVVAGAFALSGWRLHRAWVWLGLGLAMWAVADSSYVYTTAKGTYAVGGIIDTLWLAAAVAIGTAAWQPPPGRGSLESDSRRTLAVPVVFGLVAIAVLVYGGINHIHPLALGLAAAAVMFVNLRAGWVFVENIRLLERSRHDAITDALTGLGNRRLLTHDLEAALAAGANSSTGVLVMFDLDGFKLYNDRFGHLAGDTLLAHLGGRLEQSVAAGGRAYRLGGDEFCVLLSRELEKAERMIEGAVDALCVRGEGFVVTASHGVVWMPDDATGPTAALRLADDRMYAQKRSGRASARQQTHDVLLGVLRERQPELAEHLRHVGALAVAVGRELGMEVEALDELGRAAELHDIGKAAIPDAILDKPGPLDQDEWVFMRRHTLVGERILAAAPALLPVARLVRSSHERWDGRGYPDGLSGDAIPLGSRIVAVCDAFDAMIEDRPYAPAVEPETAIAELRRCGGGQFDPAVVEVFEAAWHATCKQAPPALEPRDSESATSRRASRR